MKCNETGVVEQVISEMRIDEKPAELAPKGSVCSVPVTEQVRLNDKLYKLVDAKDTL